MPMPLAHTAELDRLGDEIAELSAHLEAATARLLDLIRAFDARGGWNTGFRSCAAWLSWRVGLERIVRGWRRVDRSGVRRYPRESSGLSRYGTRTDTTLDRALSLGRRALSSAVTAYR